MNDIDTERARRSVSLTWYGQAGFRLTAGDSRVLIDPFLTDRDDRTYRPPAFMQLLRHERGIHVVSPWYGWCLRD